MAKRMRFQFGGGQNIARISRPGIDVDSAATINQFLLHEGFLFGQLSEIGYVPNSSGSANPEYNVALTRVFSYYPVVYLLFVYDGRICVPRPTIRRTSSFGGVEFMDAFVRFYSLSLLNIKVPNGADGVYYLIFRVPNA